MDETHDTTAIQVRAYPVLKGIKAAAEVPAPMVYPDLMTEEELIVYLRISQISLAKNPRNVLENLIRMRGLPCIHLCRKRMFPIEAVREWFRDQIVRRPA